MDKVKCFISYVSYHIILRFGAHKNTVNCCELIEKLPINHSVMKSVNQSTKVSKSMCPSLSLSHSVSLRQFVRQSETENQLIENDGLAD